MSISNTYSGTLYVTEAAIEAVLHFSYTHSETTTVSDTITVPAHDYGVIYYAPWATKYEIKQQWEWQGCTNTPHGRFCGSWSPPQNSNITYAYVYNVFYTSGAPLLNYSNYVGPTKPSQW